MGKKVLHVDDDPAILSIVRKTLQQREYDVISITDPLQAIDQIFENSIRVVILDIEMDVLDGLSLLHEIKSRDGGIQVIMLTGMVSIGTVLRATQLGAEDFVFKPIADLNDVTCAVDRAFAKVNRWWQALHEWMERNESIQQLANSDDRPLKLTSEVAATNLSVQ